MTVRTVQPATARRGFTLTELMIATVILLIVVIATSKIFGTASDVAGLGEANADILQEAAAIERQIRSDFARINYDGFFAIQSNAVRNDFNGAQLLDPNRSPVDRLRSDQLIFFATGLENTRNYNTSGFAGFGNVQSQQSAVARVYYGHAFQLPEAPAVHDPTVDWAPWRAGSLTLRDRDNPGSTTNFNVPVIPPRQWLLSRQVVLLADNGGDPDDYYGARNAAATIWSPDLRNGRVDIAGSTLDAVRHAVTRNGDSDFTDVDGWGVQTVMITDAFFFPRAERVPTLDSVGGNPDFVRREDHALTTHVLGSGCSQFRVEWTYNFGKGGFDNLDLDGDPFTIDPVRGVVMPGGHPQMWFGLDDLRSNINTYTELRTDGRYDDVARYLDFFNVNLGAGSIVPAAIERPVLLGGGAPNLQYRAYFGFNRDEPRDVLDIDNDGNTLEFIGDVGYTPWPDAVRITMTLHDPEGRLEGGRTFQFVVALPRRDE